MYAFLDFDRMELEMTSLAFLERPALPVGCLISAMPPVSFALSELTDAVPPEGPGEGSCCLGGSTDTILVGMAGWLNAPHRCNEDYHGYLLDAFPYQAKWREGIPHHFRPADR